MNILKSPCSYQGGKQRVSKQIVDYILKNEIIYCSDYGTNIYDICCGSGAITMEFINRGVSPKNITMLDKSSWGKFWKSIGEGSFDLTKWNYYYNLVPKDKSLVQDFMKELCQDDANIDEEYKYIILQAGSFGGKQIYKKDDKWLNTSFRNYWQPTEKSNRKSPVNPMQPSIDEINRRVIEISKNCLGINAIHSDVYDVLEIIKNDKKDDSIIYIDPPYSNTTGYGFNFDLNDFLSELFNFTLRPIYVSEKEKIAEECCLLNFNGEKGGISGNKKNKNEEWLNVFR